MVIESLGWEAFIDRYDRPQTLFYLDPPYWGSEDDYVRGLFPRSEFEKLAERLRQMRGRFILSINDVPEIRAIFAGFDMEEVRLDYRVAGGKGVPARELVVRG